jgi:hypothetical protein
MTMHIGCCTVDISVRTIRKMLVVYLYLGFKLSHVVPIVNTALTLTHETRQKRQILWNAKTTNPFFSVPFFFRSCSICHLLSLV